MSRLLRLATLLAAAAVAGATHADAATAGQRIALPVPSAASAPKRRGAAGVSASLDGPRLSISFDAEALAADARADLAPAFDADADAAKRASDAPRNAAPPAEDLPLPKGAATAGFERATVAKSARAVTVTLYRAAPAAAEPAPVASSAICVAGFGLIATLAAALSGAVYLLLAGDGVVFRHL